MKTRQGFVSNSSSCSFLIYGICIGEDGVNTLAKKLGVEPDKDDLSYTAEMICEKLGEGFDYHNPEGDDEIYIGKSFSLIKDDQTGGDFKKEIETLLGEKCGVYSEAWYNG